MKTLFQEVDLSVFEAAGKLYLHSMPGRFEPISEFVIAAGAEDIDCILCLVCDAEIGQKSPGYLEALGNETFRKRVVKMPIEDYGTPGDMEEFSGMMDILVAALDAGRNILIHCAAGVGRTGTGAICLLTDLGFDIDEATELVYEARAEPETEGQREFIRRYAGPSEACFGDLVTIRTRTRRVQPVAPAYRAGTRTLGKRGSARGGKREANGRPREYLQDSRHGLPD